MATLQWLHFSGYTPVATIQWLHFSGYNPVATLQWLHSSGYTSVATLQWLHFSGYTPVATLQWLHSSGYTSVATLQWLHSSGYTSVAALQWLHFSGYTPVATLQWLHFSGYTPVAALQGPWRYRVSAGTGWPCVSMPCLLIGCLTSQQHASVSQGRICSDKLTCCHTETEVADQTFHLTQSQYTDSGSTSSSADPITPGTWQGSHWSANFEVTGMTRPRKNPVASGIRTPDLPLPRRTP